MAIDNKKLYEQTRFSRTPPRCCLKKPCALIVQHMHNTHYIYLFYTHPKTNTALRVGSTHEHDDACTTTKTTTMQREEQTQKVKESEKLTFAGIRTYAFLCVFLFYAVRVRIADVTAPRRIWNFWIPGNNEQRGFYYETMMAGCFENKTHCEQFESGIFG